MTHPGYVPCPSKSRGPNDHINIRISHSSSKPYYIKGPLKYFQHNLPQNCDFSSQQQIWGYPGIPIAGISTISIIQISTGPNSGA